MSDSSSTPMYGSSLSSVLLPITVIVVTKNEADQITRCLAALSNFEQVIVVDSGSTDNTKELALTAGAEFIDFQWNGRYPKKRQWCLDHLDCRHDWVFMVDADEVVPPSLVQELIAIWHRSDGHTPQEVGFFIKGRYIVEEQRLKYGIMNNKLALFDKTKMRFPDIEDLSFPGMGEIEGHYQPCFIDKDSAYSIGQIQTALDHYAIENWDDWHKRHEGYADWEAHMTLYDCWPQDPVKWREYAKCTLRTSPLKPFVMFVHSYLFKRGILDGIAGFTLARSRYAYYALIRKKIKTLKQAL